MQRNGGTRMHMDEFDKRILALLQRSNLTAAEEIGSAVGLSSSAVQRRVKRLRATGVIGADVSIVDPNAVGRRVTAIVEVTLVSRRKDVIDAFEREMRQAPEVQQCYGVTGEIDFILVVTVNDFPGYEEFAHSRFVGNANIHGFRTHVVMSRAKVGLAVPLD
jgi:Lrp/AsnC family transcriptional regulator, leucine-responsive regulatory protein